MVRGPRVREGFSAAVVSALSPKEEHVEARRIFRAEGTVEAMV